MEEDQTRLHGEDLFQHLKRLRLSSSPAWPTWPELNLGAGGGISVCECDKKERCPQSSGGCFWVDGKRRVELMGVL